jgi:hypothetical protein
MLQVSGGSGGCGTSCLVPAGGTGGNAVDSGFGGAVVGGALQVSGGSGGCGGSCLIPVGGAGGNAAGFFIIDAGVSTGYGWDASGGNPIPQGGVDAQSVFPRQDAGGGTLPRNDAGPAATGPLSQGPTSWTGYIENYQFPSGSDVIRFASTVDSAGQVKVTVFLGDGPPPPPATDPNVGYPPGLGPLPSYWVEGFAYTMTSGTFQAQRLRFTIYSYQPWSGWCALQTPISGSAMCVPNWQGDCSRGPCILQDPATGQTIQVDARKALLCWAHVCACSTTACDSDPNGGTTASFDLALFGAAADGSVVGLISDRANVHFTLDPS